MKWSLIFIKFRGMRMQEYGKVAGWMNMRWFRPTKFWKTSLPLGLQDYTNTDKINKKNKKKKSLIYKYLKPIEYLVLITSTNITLGRDINALHKCFGKAVQHFQEKKVSSNWRAAATFEEHDPSPRTWKWTQIEKYTLQFITQQCICLSGCSYKRRIKEEKFGKLKKHPKP